MATNTMFGALAKFNGAGTALVNPVTGALDGLAKYIPPILDTSTAFGGKGDLLVAWATAPSATTSSSRLTDYSEVCPDPEYPQYIAKMNGTSPAQQTIYDHVPASAISMSGVDSLGFWAMATVRPGGENYTDMKMMLAADTGFAAYGVAEFPIRADGKWHYCVIPLSGFYAAGAWTVTSSIAVVRFREGDTVSGRSAMTTAESFFVGPIRKNPRGKAIGLIRFDDCTETQYAVKTAIAAFTGTSGVTIPAASYSMQELVSLFGFKANCYILTDSVGQPGFLSKGALRTLQDKHGWDICFQTKVNPIGAGNTGVRLLGPVGYNLVPIGGVSSVDITADTITTTAAHGVTVVGTSAGGIQSFPVSFIGTDLPAPLVTGTKYFLSQSTTTTCKVHTTALGSVSASAIVDLTTTGIVANFGIRYWGSTNDYTAILNDFQQGRDWLIAEGFNGYDHYALNQGAWDIYSERAALEVGFKTNWGIQSDTYSRRVATFDVVTDMVGTASTGKTDRGASQAPWMNIPTGISTDGTITATQARTYVQKLVSTGSVGGNYHHSLTAANALVLLAYLDELKVQSNAGNLSVLTITEFQEAVDAALALNAAKPASVVSDVTLIRALNTTYKNANPGNLAVSVSARCVITLVAGSAYIQSKSDFSTPPTTKSSGIIGIQVGLLNEDNSAQVAFIVPPGRNYRVDSTAANGTVTLGDWFETVL